MFYTDLLGDNPSKVNAILTRKAIENKDCTEDESAELKQFIKKYFGHPRAGHAIGKIAELFPCEYSEAMEETENH